MAIDKINLVYNGNTLATTYDGESKTVLEITAMVSAKVDECVEAVNGVGQIATEAEQIVDTMRTEQENFINANDVTRQEILDAQTTLINDVNLAKNTLITQVTAEKDEFIQESNAVITGMQGDFTTFKSQINAEKDQFVSESNTIINNQQTAYNTFNTQITTEKNEFIAESNTLIANQQNAYDTFSDNLDSVLAQAQSNANTAVTNITANSATTIANDVSNKIDTMANDGTLASTLNVKKYIFISDSYGVSPSTTDNWISKIITMMNLSGKAWSGSFSGKGFNVSGENGFLTGLQSMTVPDHNAITDIVVCGGANDMTTNQGDYTGLQTGIANFITYCKTNYPNAKVHIGFIGYTKYGSTYAGVSSLINYLNCLRFYKTTTQSNGGVYLEGVEQILHQYVYLSTADWLHPTTDGAYNLAVGIMQALLTGYTNVSSAGEYMRITPISGTINGSATESLIGTTYLQGQNILWDMTGFSIVRDVSIGNTFVDIATFTCPVIYGNDAITWNVNVQAIIDSALVYTNVPMQFQLYRGKLQARSLLISSGVFETHTFHTTIVPATNMTIPTLRN